jgi:cyclic dehypoxanthinyl futalosine synthase
VSPADPRPAVADALAKAVAGGRIDDAEALLLIERGDLVSLGKAARAVSRRLHPEGYRTYVVDRNINYSNVCDSYCRFCGFYRVKGEKDAYVLPKEEIRRKVAELKAIGGTQVLLQGGTHPDLPLEWYEDLVRFFKSLDIHLHGFSPPEIQKMAAVSGLPVREVIRRLVAAGLDSIPGGGAEILVDRVREAISPHKIRTGEWLEVMREAHGLGLKTSATMMFGHRETLADRVEHLRRVRELQDETGGFTAFIPWAFQPTHAMVRLEAAGSHDYLRTLAVARLHLQNVPNIQSSWVTMGPKVGQLALHFGANDMGSVMLEENVVSTAGVRFRMGVAELRRVIEDAGYLPAQRDFFYRPIATAPGAAASGAAPAAGTPAGAAAAAAGAR